MKILITVLGLTCVLLLSACQTTQTNKAPALSSEEIRIYLSRHAEKRSGQGKNPRLTETGEQQAQSLANALSTVPLDVIYSTPYKRTMSTAEPTSRVKGVPIVSEYLPADVFAKKIKSQHLGQQLLIVGHSNTVPELIHALGSTEKVEIDHDDYAELFILHIDANGNTTLSRQNY